MASLATSPGADSEWIGRSREEIVENYGKPQSSLHRGDTEILMFAKGVRAEIRDNVVVALRAGGETASIVRNGTRYAPSDEGKVRATGEPVVTVIEPGEVEEPAPSTPPVVATASTPAEPDPEMETETDVADDEFEDLAAPTGDMTAVMPLSPETTAFLETGKLPEPPPPPAWVGWAGTGIGAILRLAVAFVVLRLALRMVDLPSYAPDVAKVAVGYVLIRDGLDALGELGGYWQFLHFFRVGDVVGFFAIAVLLFRFKVVLTGLTALKVAVATKAATYGLMIAAGLAVTFGLQAFY